MAKTVDHGKPGQPTWSTLDRVDTHADGDEWRKMILEEIKDIEKDKKRQITLTMDDPGTGFPSTLPFMDSEDEDERDGTAANP